MTPKIIAVASTKGGVGKTTLAIQLATTTARFGHDVWLVDGDRQQTASTALSLRESSNRPPIACAAYTDGKMMLTQIKLQKDKWDVIIIDVGGMDSTTLRAALLICDVLVVPFQPRSFALWSVYQVSSLIEEAKQIRGDFPVYSFINCAETRTDSPDNLATAKELRKCESMTFLECPLSARKIFATASASGLSILEASRIDVKAKVELIRLMNFIFRDGKEEQGLTDDELKKAGFEPEQFIRTITKLILSKQPLPGKRKPRK